MLILYIMFCWLLGICYGFVLISSAAGLNHVDLFQVGESATYELHSTVLLNEKGDNAKNVGFFINTQVQIDTVWGNDEQERVIKFELKDPRLYIRSRKAPAPDGFTQHSSKLQEYASKPFYILWKSGIVEKIIFWQKEPLALVNLKKGVASLFQFQLIDGEFNETDASGACQANYRSLGPNKFDKIKTNCTSDGLNNQQDEYLGIDVVSSRNTFYEIKSSHIETIHAKEKHSMVLNIRQDLGSFVENEQILTFVSTDKAAILQGSSSSQVIEQISKGHAQESLKTHQENFAGDDTGSLASLVGELRTNLQSKNLGSVVSAKSFLRLVEAARKTTLEELSKILSAKKNEAILPQIYDVLGYIQTERVHELVLKKLHFDREEHGDLSERYLWALSLSPQPNLEIIKDLLNRWKKNDNFPEKIKETLLLTIAAMTRQANLPPNNKIALAVEESITNGLDYAKNEDRFIFLRALKNLKLPSTLPLLLKTAKTGTPKEGVLAFKALKSFNPVFWDQNVIKQAHRSFLQLDRKFDSSARTLAADILLTNPSEEILRDLVLYLRTNETVFEVKQYVFQQLQMLADDSVDFQTRLFNIIKSDPSLNNYVVLAPRGLSTAFKRNFMKNGSVNGSLLTIQEISSGIVKRGIVNVMLDKNSDHRELFSLGLFAGGLGSFVSSSDSSDGEEEVATAGMELTILGRQIRPFVFFSGQGELMGHVWSGTASEKTTAFQAAILLQNFVGLIRLGSGFTAELRVDSAVSFDLSGKIEISIWGRTADSVVEKTAGLFVKGLIAVDSSFVRSQIEFVASLEPKLSIKSDIDFLGSVNLCMRVTQPDSVFRHSTFKVERIPGSKHKLRIAKYKKSTVPGKTYSLNRINNEMCSAMFR